MPDSHILLANNPEVEWVLERIKKHVSATPSKVVLAVIQNPAIYYACLGVKRHETMNSVQKKEIATNSFKNFVVAAFRGFLTEQCDFHFPGWLTDKLMGNTTINGERCRLR